MKYLVVKGLIQKNKLVMLINKILKQKDLNQIFEKKMQRIDGKYRVIFILPNNNQLSNNLVFFNQFN